MATELAKAYVQIVPSVQNIGSNISDELSDILASADNAENSLSQVGVTAGGVGGDLNALGSDINSAGNDLDTLGSNAGSAGNDLGSMGDNAISAGNDVNSLGNDADSTDNAIDALVASITSAGSEMGSMGTDADSAGGSLSSLASDAVDSGGSFDALSTTIGGTGDSIAGLGSDAGSAIGDLSGLGDTLSNDVAIGANDADGMVESVSSVIDGLATGGIVAGATALLGELGSAFADLAQEAQEASATIAQGTGATGEELEEFENIARAALGNVQLASSTNLNDVANTVAALNTRFHLTGEELQQTATDMTDFAAITGQTGADAVDKIANATNAWELSSEDIPGLLDQITAASQASNLSASDLETALAKNATQFDILGMSADEAISFLAAYGASSGDVSEAQRALRSAVTNLNGEVDDVPGTFSAAIDAIKDADSKTDALNATVGDTGMTVEDVFGSTNAQKVVNSIYSEAFAMDDMTEAISNSSGAMQQTAADSVTFSDQMSSAGNEVKGGFTDAMDTISNSLLIMEQNAFEASTGLAAGMESGAEGVTAAAQGLGDDVVNGFNDELGINSPSTVMMESGQDVTAGLTEGMSGMAEGISGELDETLGVIQSFSEQSEESVSNSASMAANAVSSGYSSMPTSIETPLAGALSNITSWGSQATEAASTSASQYVQNTQSGMSSLPNTVNQELTGAMSNVTSWGSNMDQQASTIAKSFVSNFNNGWSNFGNQVSNKLTSVLSTVTTWGTNMTSKATSIAKDFVTNFNTKFADLGDKVQTSLDAASKKVTDWQSDFEGLGTTIAGNFVSNYTSEIGGLKTATSDALKDAKDKATGYKDTMSSAGGSIGKALVQGMIDGIDSKSSNLYSKIEKVVSNAISKANSAAGTGSPSRYLMWTGQMMDEGLAIGLTKYSGEVNDAMNDVMAIMDTANNINYEASVKSANRAGEYGIQEGAVINITQNIYSEAKTAAQLMKEAKYEAQRAVMQGV